MSDRPLPSSFDGDPDFYQENRLAKIWRRLREEPLVPLGAALTCVALYRASRSIRTGNKGYTNKMFRMRIYAQAFTIAAMIAGSYYYKEQRSAQKEVAAAVAQQKAREKHAAWIRELEVRNREDREMQEREKKLSQRRRERQQQQQQQKEQQQQEQQQQEEEAKKAA